VIYLAKLYPLLANQLKEKNRLDWLTPAFTDLCKPSLYANPPELAWKRIRAAKRLKGASLSILQKTAEWRETLAQQKNIPRGWLIKDDLLIELAKLKPTTVDSLSNIRGIPDKFTEKFGLAIIDIIAAALENKPAPKDIQKKPNKVSEKEEALADLLMAQVRLKAADANVNPSSITSRKELLQLIQGQRDLELLSDWRNEMIGQDLMATLNGLHTFQVVSGELNIST